jgi:hypothetical protein
MRGAQATASPNLGAPAAPAAWQAPHWAWYTCAPVCSTLGASTGLTTIVPTGCSRRATASSDMASLPAPGFAAKSAKMASPTKASTGSTHAATRRPTDGPAAPVGPGWPSSAVASGSLLMSSSSAAAGRQVPRVRQASRRIPARCAGAAK